jgi:hypothetical protein
MERDGWRLAHQGTELSIKALSTKPQASKNKFQITNHKPLLIVGSIYSFGIWNF